jgi:hypothetical protein
VSGCQEKLPEYLAQKDGSVSLRLIRLAGDENVIIDAQEEDDDNAQDHIWAQAGGRGHCWSPRHRSRRRPGEFREPPSLASGYGNGLRHHWYAQGGYGGPAAQVPKSEMLPEMA